MTLTKIFFALAITGLFFTASCTKDDSATYGAELWCELIQLRQESRAETDKLKKDEIETRISTIMKEFDIIEKNLKEKYKNDKKGKLKYDIEAQKALLKCDVISDAEKRKIKENLKENEIKLKKLD